MSNVKMFSAVLLSLLVLGGWGAANALLWHELVQVNTIWQLIGSMATGMILPGFALAFWLDLKAGKR